MSLRRFATAVAALACAAAEPAAPQLQTDFRFELRGHAQLAFTSDESFDRIDVSVTGKSPDDATFLVTIRDAKGNELYRYASAYESVAEDACSVDSARELIEFTLEGAGRKRMDSLPDWESAADAKDEPEELLVPFDRYRRLRDANVQIVQVRTSFTDYEKWQYVAFDRDTREVIVFMRASDLRSKPWTR
jgi:hypothetical protein